MLLNEITIVNELLLKRLTQVCPMIRVDGVGWIEYYVTTSCKLAGAGERGFYRNSVIGTRHRRAPAGKQL